MEYEEPHNIYINSLSKAPYISSAEIVPKSDLSELLMPQSNNGRAMMMTSFDLWTVAFCTVTVNSQRSRQFVSKL